MWVVWVRWGRNVMVKGRSGFIPTMDHNARHLEAHTTHHGCPGLDLPSPVAECGEWRDDHERPGVAAQLALELQHRDRLCGLAQAHLRATDGWPRGWWVRLRVQ